MYASGDDFASWIERVNTFHAEAIPAVRAIFGGSLTYGATAWEAPSIAWDHFDIVGINAYRTSENAATFADDLRYNYDMVNFGITKTFEDGSGRSYPAPLDPRDGLRAYDITLNC